MASQWGMTATSVGTLGKGASTACKDKKENAILGVAEEGCHKPCFDPKLPVAQVQVTGGRGGERGSATACKGAHEQVIFDLRQYRDAEGGRGGGGTGDEQPLPIN